MLMENHESGTVSCLRRSERELLNLLAQAATEADYDEIDRARTAAARVNKLIAELSPRSSNAGVAQAGGSNKSDTKSAPSVRKRRQSSNRSKEKQTDYPQFIVEGHSLVKVGWSKKSRSTYKHRVPLESVQRAIKAMQRIAETADGPLTADVILNEPSLKGDKPVPAYQVYVVIALLRANSVIRQVGREGYLLPADLQEQADGLLENLIPSHQPSS